MTVVILTGPLGVGKTSLQRRLQAEHGFWSPTTHTTRPVDLHEVDLRSCDLPEFETAVRQGSLVMPAQFAGNWYAWDSNALDRMRQPDAKTVVNVRPYTGLVLAALLPRCVPCWLWVDAHELARRRTSRGEQRDTTSEARAARERADETDRRYEYLFPHRVCSDERALDIILALAENAVLRERSD
jgi:guanylate kinase